MRTFSAGPALAACALLFGAALAASAQTSQEDFRWSGRLSAGERVEIKGINGGIRAEPSDGGEVEVTAVRRDGRHLRAEDVRIERVMHDGGVTVCAIYPPSSDIQNRCEPGSSWIVNTDGQDARVEFVVRVPRGIHFLGSTVNGDVDARAMPADASVSTVNGSVAVSAAGTVSASTVNGAVDAVTDRADLGRSMSFSTVNGNITLRVPARFRANVRASLLNAHPERLSPDGEARQVRGEPRGGRGRRRRALAEPADRERQHRPPPKRLVAPAAGNGRHPAGAADHTDTSVARPCASGFHPEPDRRRTLDPPPRGGRIRERAVDFRFVVDLVAGEAE